MIKVGITGGIGSGKTTVCKMFATMGIPIYYADDRAKQLMVSEEGLITNIIDLLGEKAYIEGELNRKYIADQVFADVDKLAKLNGLVHPVVATDAERWFISHSEEVPFAIQEAALLHESGSYTRMDKVITVIAPLKTRIDRVVARDETTREEVMARAEKQWTDAQRKKHTDYIIENDGTLFLIPQVLKIYTAISGIDLEQIPPRFPKK